MKQKAVKIEAARIVKDVHFKPITGSLNNKIDDACQKIYGSSPYLQPMISKRAKEATVQVV